MIDNQDNKPNESLLEKMTSDLHGKLYNFSTVPTSEMMITRVKEVQYISRFVEMGLNKIFICWILKTFETSEVSLGKKPPFHIGKMMVNDNNTGGCKFIFDTALNNYFCGTNMNTVFKTAYAKNPEKSKLFSRFKRKFLNILICGLHEANYNTEINDEFFKVLENTKVLSVSNNPNFTLTEDASYRPTVPFSYCCHYASYPHAVQNSLLIPTSLVDHPIPTQASVLTTGTERRVSTRNIISIFF